MSNTYNVKTSRKVILRNITEGQRAVLTNNLVLHGRGAKNYHLDRNQNLVYLLENFAGSPAPINPLDGQLWWDLQRRSLKIFNSAAGSPWQGVVPTGQGVGFGVVPGDGLEQIGGSPVNSNYKPVGSPLTLTLQIKTGNDSVTVAADSISINVSQVDHDLLNGFFASEHVDHSNIIITGDGMLIDGVTSADLTVSRTLNISNGDGITANANDVAVNSTVVRTTGNQTVSGVKTFTAPSSIQASQGTAGAPSYGFASDANTGVYHAGGAGGSPSVLGFSTNSTLRFTIDNRGVLKSNNTTYETLVTEDDDIPNKKYVDDVVSGTGGGSVTQNTFVASGSGGVLSISGLTSGKKYLVTVYGVTRNAGTGIATLGGIRITSVAGTPPTSGLLYQGPLFTGIDWPDGNVPQHSMAVITAPAGGTIYGYVDYRDDTPPAIEWENALYMTATQLN